MIKPCKVYKVLNSCLFCLVYKYNCVGTNGGCTRKGVRVKGGAKKYIEMCFGDCFSLVGEMRDASGIKKVNKSAKLKFMKMINI